MTIASTLRKKVLFVTTSRSDFATIEPLLLMFKNDADLEPVLFVTGDHLSEAAGETYTQIEAAGHSIDGSYKLQSDAPAAQAGEVMSALSKFFVEQQISYALLCGDRKETFAAAAACALAKIPVFHIHGGDVTFGMIDDAMRHAITKLASIHFPASDLSAKRIRQMGEEEWRIFMTGSPDVDRLTAPLPEEETLKNFSLESKKFALLLLNPETLLDAEGNGALAREVTSALSESFNGKVIAIYPNNDPSSANIRAAYDALPEKFTVVKGLPREQYLSLLKVAAFLIGNSSSGITEAATFKTAAVNVGERQAGRERSINVIDSAADSSSIAGAIQKVLSPEFQDMLREVENVYGNGGASEKIFEAMKKISREYNTRSLLYKKFELI